MSGHDGEITDLPKNDIAITNTAAIVINRTDFSVSAKTEFHKFQIQIIWKHSPMMSLRRLAASRLRSGECPMGAASRTPDVAAKLHPFRVKGWLKVYSPIGPLIRFRRCRSLRLWPSFSGDSFALKSKVRRVHVVLLATCGYDRPNVRRFVSILY